MVFLANASYYPQIIDPGPRQYVATFADFRPKIVNVDCKAGERLYIKFDFSMGKVSFVQVNEAVALKDLDGLRRVLPEK